MLGAWLAFQIEVLVSRSNHRLAKIADRIELLDGYLIAYLNLDRVIADHPHRGRAQAGDDRRVRASPTARPRRSSTCGCARLRKLEEMQIRKERDELEKEQAELEKLVESTRRGSAPG